MQKHKIQQVRCEGFTSFQLENEGIRGARERCGWWLGNWLVVGLAAMVVEGGTRAGTKAGARQFVGEGNRNES